MPLWVQACVWGSVLPQSWSFMLAARARGLVSAWTQMHIQFEEEVAAVLGINHAEVQQAALIPVAYPRREDFKPAYGERSRSCHALGQLVAERTTGLRRPAYGESTGLKSTLEFQVFLADGELVALCEFRYEVSLNGDGGPGPR